MNMRDNGALEAVIRVIPAELKPERDGDSIRLSCGDAPRFRPIWVGEGLPADARRGTEEIARLNGDGEFEDLPVIVARRISSGSQELLETEGISWVDVSGRARITVPGSLYLARLDPLRPVVRDALRWSPATAAAVEAVLVGAASAEERPLQVARVTDVAAATGLSAAHTARILRQLDEQRYTTKTGAERGATASRTLEDPGRLLSDWAGHYAVSGGPGRGFGLHVPWREAETSVALLDAVLTELDWAVTSEFASDLSVPYLTNLPILEAYVSRAVFAEARARFAQHEDVREVESGARIRVYAADPYLLANAEDFANVRSVSPVRVYADLLRHGGRALEVAEHLREQRIGF